jgi:hypothetical protein
MADIALMMSKRRATRQSRETRGRGDLAAARRTARSTPDWQARLPEIASVTGHRAMCGYRPYGRTRRVAVDAIDESIGNAAVETRSTAPDDSHTCAAGNQKSTTPALW